MRVFRENSVYKLFCALLSNFFREISVIFLPGIFFCVHILRFCFSSFFPGGRFRLCASYAPLFFREIFPYAHQQYFICAWLLPYAFSGKIPGLVSLTHYKTKQKGERGQERRGLSGQPPRGGDKGPQAEASGSTGRGIPVLLTVALVYRGVAGRGGGTGGGGSRGRREGAGDDRRGGGRGRWRGRGQVS